MTHYPKPNVYSPPKADIGIVEVMRPDNTVHSAWLVPGWRSHWFNELMQVYPLHLDPEPGPSPLPVVRVPYANAAWAPPPALPFNACTFDACADYLAACFGRKLHDTDKKWLAAHPWALDSGLPMAATPMALHQLLEPYGLGVSHVRLRTGTTVAGEQLSTWMYALGVNPFGMVDAATTNAQAAAQLGMSLADANEMFRFEFHDEPFRPSVVGEKGWSNTSTVKTGTYGGHARYLAPRADPYNWAISVQLRPLADCNYLIPPVAPEYVPRTAPLTALLADFTKPDGTKCAITAPSMYSGNATSPPAVSGFVGEIIRVTPLNADGTPRVGQTITQSLQRTTAFGGFAMCPLCEQESKTRKDVALHCTECLKYETALDGTFVRKANEPLPPPTPPAPAQLPLGLDTLAELERAANAVITAWPTAERGPTRSSTMPQSWCPLCAVCELEYRTTGDYPMECDYCDVVWNAQLRTNGVAHDTSPPTPVKTAETSGGCAPMVYHPYSQATCTNCELLFDTFVPEQLHVDGISGVARYPHTGMCQDCVADLLVHAQCPDCRAPLADTTDAVDWRLPTITAIDAAPTGVVPLVTFACPTCRACTQQAVSDMTSPYYPLLYMLVMEDVLATPQDFARGQAGRNLEAEYLDTWGGEPPLPKEAQDLLGSIYEDEHALGSEDEIDFAWPPVM